MNPDPLPFFETLRADIEAHIPPDRRGEHRLARRVWVVVGSSGFHVALLHRSGHSLRARFAPFGRVAASFLSWTIRHAYGCSIAPTARIGGGLILPHPQGIVIGPGSEIGPRAWIFQHVTIGGSPGRSGMPRIGEDARIYPGAVVAGPIEVGSSVVIGGNVVVNVDVPDSTLVRSPPLEFSPIRVVP